MNLRRFNTAGIEAFRDALAACREHPQSDISEEMIESPEWTELIVPEIPIQLCQFTTKRDAAIYFHDLLEPLSEQQIVSDSGMWSWLSLAYFDSICPKKNGQRRIRNDYTYVYQPDNMRH